VNKTKVLILFGGRSTEHEVSINSTRNVVQALDTKLYDPILVGLSKESGTWYYFQGNTLPHSMTLLSDSDAASGVIVNLCNTGNSINLISTDASVNIPIHFVLPITHGKYGEDGCLQGFCRILNLPFAGSSVASSAVCMDKDYTKRILETQGIPVTPYTTIFKNDPINFEVIEKKLGLPLFLKPANTGSSVGVYKVKSKAEFDKFIPIVFQYDDKIVIEKYIPGREIECAVLGNHTPTASVLGEIKPNHDFYSYEAKYLDPEGADLAIPALVDEATAKKVQAYAIDAYKVLGCKGFARVDFFVTATNEIYLNEINTIPGFTNISMYPKLFEASGIPYADLLNEIIKLGIEDFQTWNTLSTEHHLF
jgi:D-alanine-D-alanine ligase